MHKEEVFQLPEGIVTMRFPEKMTAQSVQDLEDRFAIIVRQLRRAASEPDSKPTT